MLSLPFLCRKQFIGFHVPRKVHNTTSRKKSFSLFPFTLFPFSHNNAPSKLKNSRVHFATSHLLITGRRREDDIELSFCPHFHLRSNLEKQNFSHRGAPPAQISHDTASTCIQSNHSLICFLKIYSLFTG